MFKTLCGFAYSATELLPLPLVIIRVTGWREVKDFCLKLSLIDKTACAVLCCPNPSLPEPCLQAVSSKEVDNVITMRLVLPYITDPD